MSGLLPGVHICLSVRPRLQVMRSGRGSSSAACRMAVEMQMQMQMETETETWPTDWTGQSLREW